MSLSLPQHGPISPPIVCGRNNQRFTNDGQVRNVGLQLNHCRVISNNNGGGSRFLTTHDDVFFVQNNRRFTNMYRARSPGLNINQCFRRNGRSLQGHYQHQQNSH